ncbi:MAG: alpha/beta fold hydrolase [Candidatus Eisenbacteria bacterium]
MTPGSSGADETAAIARLAALTLEGPAGPLEVLLQEWEGREHPIAAVVCHPHPLYGGTLHNKVVHRAAGVLHALGAAVLRFNFRGVGRSAGAHDRGSGELEDARAALEWMRVRHPRARAWLAGFSFGSWIAARLAAESPQAERLILIAPPIRTSSFTALYDCTTPKLVIQGTADDICPPELLKVEFPRWADPKKLVLVPGGTHFFDRKLAELAAALEGAIRDEGWA